MDFLYSLFRPKSLLKNGSESPLCPRPNRGRAKFVYKDWIFSKKTSSGVKQGMQRSKNGSNMGGKNKQNTKKESHAPRSVSPISHHDPTERPLIVGSSNEAITGTKNVSASAESGDDNSSTSGHSGTSGSSSSPSGKKGGGSGARRKNFQKRLRHASTTDTEENGSDVSSTLEREPPDGGWGWVVVGAAFFVNLIADGVTFSFGVFFTEFSNVFGESKSTTAWVASLLAAMPLLSGPIASSLTDRFGCRKVTICGGLIAATGFILSSYATSIYMLMLTVGVITGFGLSLCYVAAVVIVAYYFERRRSFATGLSVCGGGIGTFLFAPWTEYLIREYGWRGTTLILAGAFLNLCVCGALMRDLEWTKKSSKKRDKLLQNEHDFNTQAQQNLLAQGEHGCHSLEGNASMALKNERLCNSALCIPTFVQEQERRNSRRIRYYSNNYGNVSLVPTGYEDDLIRKKNNKMTKKIKNNDKASSNKNSLKTTTTTIVSNSNETLTQKEPEKDKKDTKNRESGLFRTGSSCGTTIGPNSNNVTFNNSNGCILSNSNSNSNYSCSSPPPPPAVAEINSNSINLNDTSYLIKTHSNNSNSNNNLNHSSSIIANNESNGSVLNGNLSNHMNNNGEAEPTALQKQQAMKNYVVHHTRNWSGRHRHSITYRGAVVGLKRYRLRPASSCPDIISVATTDDRSGHEWKALLSDIYIWMREVFAWENLANTRFLLFIMSNFLLYMWYDIPYIFLADSATEIGYTKAQGSFLGSTIGICNVFGNIILGYIGDKKWANSIMVYGICISICGGVTALMPYFITVNYYLLSVLCGFFGVMIAANYSLTPVILLKVVSLDRFANAYGLLLLVQGVGNLVGPPIAGMLYDWSGTYSWSFLVAGGGIFVSNFFILAPIYKNSGEDEDTSGDSVDREVSQA